MEIRIGHFNIGPNRPPFVIAEMSGNHNGSLRRALAIVDAAAQSGAQALKIQTYTADTMTLNLRKGEFSIRNRKSLWNGRSLYELYRQASTPWSWHKAIFERCRQRGLIGFSTPFDATAVDFLEDLNIPLYKIASFENVDLPLIERVARTGKPVILSTGMANRRELDEAVRAARQAGCRQLVLLKCTSAYPADPAYSNLRTIPALQRLYSTPVGLSDHTLGIGASLAAVALGACVIERHFTLSRKSGGVDAAFSLEPREMAQLVVESRTAQAALGKAFLGVTRAEKSSVQFRRSLYVTQDVAAGERLTSDNLRSIRPGLGLPPKYLKRLLGKRAKRRISMGTPMQFELVN